MARINELSLAYSVEATTQGQFRRLPLFERHLYKLLS
jgi:hypothetical protein